MNLKRGLLVKKVSAVLLAQTMLFSSVVGVSAAEVQANSTMGRISDPRMPSIKLEYLDRGLVATKTTEGVFLSWRFLGNEVTGYSLTGLTGANFNVYRDGVKIATVEDSTNYLDKGVAPTSKYYVKAVVNGKEVDQSSEVSPLANNYFELKLKKPADQTMPKGVLFPNGEVCTYEANDMSVGDVDGDGQYEYFVKWYPSNAKDVSQRGYTGNTFMDCYESDGTLLYRLDLGVNVRSGAHYTQFMVYDFDQDGKAEMMLKTAPGTKMIKYDKDGNVISENYVTMPQSDIDAGYKNTDDYRLSAEGYFNHVVDMFMGWDKHPEVVNGNWPKTIEGCLGKTDKTYTYPLSKADATELANYFIDTYAISRSVNNKLREFEGFILNGPEYLSVFNGETGAEMKTIPYKTERDDDGLLWGDYAMGRIEPGNRVDRFLAGVAYLDGQKPYALFARGYYTRTTMVTYSWDGKDLKENWYVDSGHAPMSNPFNAGPHGVDGTNPEYGNITTQGAHSLSIADVDGDGKDEIVYGGATIDHNGKVLYSSFATVKVPVGSGLPASPIEGQNVRLGHGDSLHVADVDPSRPGLESFMCFEGGTYAPYGSALRDAKTGEVIYGLYRGKDNGRAMIGDVDPTKPGLETWSNGFWDAKGNAITGTAPGTNANIKWAADMTTQTVDGSGTAAAYISAWDYANTKKPVTVFTATGTLTNNGTKGNPSLVADVFGDWREELLVRTTDSSAIRIYTSTEVTNHKLYTLMHDAKYRTDIARQNTTYNQPAYTSFYFGSDTNWADVVPTIASAKLSADKTTVDRTKTAQLSITDVKLASGLDADLSKATIKYASSNPSILDVDSQGKITTYKPGNAEVTATITLYDKVVQTNPVVITVNQAYMDAVELTLKNDSVRNDKLIVDVNQEFKVKLNVKGAKDLYGFKVNFNYNPALFEYKGVKAHSDFSADSSKVYLLDNYDYDNIEKATGKVTIEGALLGQNQGVTGEINVIEITLKAKSVDALTAFEIAKGASLSNMATLEYATTTNALLTSVIANADNNGDGYSIGDVVAVAKAFRLTVKDNGYRGILDTNKDDVVDIIDIAYVAQKVLNE
jgi:hypothetical protein